MFYDLRNQSLFYILVAIVCVTYVHLCLGNFYNRRRLQCYDDVILKVMTIQISCRCARVHVKLKIEDVLEVVIKLYY